MTRNFAKIYLSSKFLFFEWKIFWTTKEKGWSSWYLYQRISLMMTWEKLFATFFRFFQRQNIFFRNFLLNFFHFQEKLLNLKNDKQASLVVLNNVLLFIIFLYWRNSIVSLRINQSNKNILISNNCQISLLFKYTIF